ncbi:NTP transferase domain-containing protein [Larkinella terrae]|uniref:Probable molybdenum cofactor guanylyltransferase n=1 Tax=Larkinella terrae TaxID=2025311 RepID=A0A7K0EGV5_9BACT|nr:NTP transferase domain-containing protein [Larkinella terrae]MRS60995.1 NTP transferase domain-containing protein [Larkinella terrae]
MTSTKPPEPTPALLGLVLAGGRSTRMGVDKSTIDYHGKPQFEYLHDLLSPYCDDVFVSVNAEQANQWAVGRFKLIEDQASVAGPLVGILTAFQQQSAHHAWLAVVCDLPLLSEQSIRKLVENRNPDKMATVFWDSDHRFPDPSICIWEPAAYPAILRAIEAGAPFPRTILMTNDIELVEIDNVRELINANTPDDRAVIRQHLQTGKHPS